MGEGVGLYLAIRGWGGRPIPGLTGWVGGVGLYLGLRGHGSRPLTGLGGVMGVGLYIQ